MRFGNIDPKGRPTVTVGLSSLFKISQNENSDDYCRDCRSSRVDHCLIFLFLFAPNLDPLSYAPADKVGQIIEEQMRQGPGHSSSTRGHFCQKIFAVFPWEMLKYV